LELQNAGQMRSIFLCLKSKFRNLKSKDSKDYADRNAEMLSS